VRLRAIYLVHGTFVGDDAAGLFRTLALIRPDWSAMLRRVYKGTVDRLAQDAGNYTAEFARKLERMTGVPTQLFFWSSENHHLARAQAAICLLNQLLALDLGPDERVWVWGHSHGGNVLALLTNLLAADAESRARFFQACRGLRAGAGSDQDEAAAWSRVPQWLAAEPPSRRFPQLDLVTFGTPIRYGWDSGGYAKLLHFVHHRPRPDRPAYQTALPRSLDDVLTAADGDYVQHWGIAGTNFPPPIWVWREWQADRRLNALLQGGLRARDLPQRLQAGVRVPEEGETVLVDYGPVTESVFQHLAGHAAYTRVSWLPFHAAEVVRRFYGSA
jgi:hypothetical protein